MMIIITTATMALSFNRGYHWRNACPELNYVHPLWVNISPDLNLTPLAFLRFLPSARQKRKKAARGVRFKSGLGQYMFRKSSKAHRHILFILQNIERRYLIAIFSSFFFFFFFFFLGGGGGGLRGLRFVEAIYPFLLQKKNRIQNSVSVRWSIQIEKIGSAYYIYIHISYISYTHHIHITLVVPSRQCLFTYFRFIT